MEGKKLRARREEAIEDLTPAQRQHYAERIRQNDVRSPKLPASKPPPPITHSYEANTCGPLADALQELKQEVASMQHRVFNLAGEVAKCQQELQQVREFLLGPSLSR